MKLVTTRRVRVVGAFLLVLAWQKRPAAADDKDLLVRTSAPSNVLIVFGNSQTTTQPILGSTSSWDGDADSQSSKMGASKRVVTRFVADKAGQYNFGLSSFSHNPTASSIAILRKHWLYAPMTVDYPSETWNEPVGTIERWGNLGPGPCTTKTVPACSDQSPSYVTLPSAATVVGPFFGVKGDAPAYVYLDGNSSSATKRIKVTLLTGEYGDAFTDATLSAYVISTPAPAHSVEVRKEYQVKVSGNWGTVASTPNGDPADVTISYIPPVSLAQDLFFQVGADGGKAIGFLSDTQSDFDVNANCSGWEFQSNSAPLPLIKIPRDYLWGRPASRSRTPSPA